MTPNTLLSLPRSGSTALIAVLCLLLSACFHHGSGTEHLEEAIELYESRRHEYSVLTNGVSDSLFNRLIGLERAAIPLAKHYDWLALPFNAEGIGIVRDDFVSMDAVKAVTAPVTPASPWSSVIEPDVKQLISTLPTAVSDNYAEVADITFQAIVALDLLEQQHNIYLAMTRHVLESIGFAAINAVDYAALSEGRSNSLANRFISLQIQTLRASAADLDRRANRSHQLGVGVLVNDLPHIPFEAKYLQQALNPIDR